MLAQWGGGWGMGPGYGMGYGMGWGGGVVMLLFWVVVIVGIIVLVRWLTSAPRHGAVGRGEDTALELLKKRYARGEISKEEFQEKRKDLEG